MFKALQESVSPLTLQNPGQNQNHQTLAEIKKNIPEPFTTLKGAPLTSRWSFNDYLGAFLARISSTRNDYRIEPGLYAFGSPDENSEVLVSCNYKYSFDLLRKNLADKKFWILVLDTKGINVWCAAGKGTFGTKELISRIEKTGLVMRTAHRRLIVPQLGAVGVAAHEVKKATGFRVSYGPADVRDLLEYLDTGKKATEKMRRVRFNWYDRLLLVPMEFIPALKHYVKYALAALLIFGLQQEGFLFSHMISAGGLYLGAGLLAVMAGAVISPLFLPVLPFRSFAAKGAIAGMVVAIAFIYLLATSPVFSALAHNFWFFAFALAFIPAVSSFYALQFTGASAYTNMSGVYKEHKYALPFYISALFFSAIFLLAHKLSLHHWIGESIL